MCAMFCSWVKKIYIFKYLLRIHAPCIFYSYKINVRVRAEVVRAIPSRV